MPHPIEQAVNTITELARKVNYWDLHCLSLQFDRHIRAHALEPDLLVNALRGVLYCLMEEMHSTEFSPGRRQLILLAASGSEADQEYFKQIIIDSDSQLQLSLLQVIQNVGKLFQPDLIDNARLDQSKRTEALFAVTNALSVIDNFPRKHAGVAAVALGVLLSILGMALMCSILLYKPGAAIVEAAQQMIQNGMAENNRIKTGIAAIERMCEYPRLQDRPSSDLIRPRAHATDVAGTPRSHVQHKAKA